MLQIVLDTQANRRGISPTSVYLFEIGALVDSETIQKITGAFFQFVEEQPTVATNKESVLQRLPGGGDHGR